MQLAGGSGLIATLTVILLAFVSIQVQSAAEDDGIELLNNIKDDKMREKAARVVKELRAHVKKNNLTIPNKFYKKGHHRNAVGDWFGGAWRSFKCMFTPASCYIDKRTLSTTTTPRLTTVAPNMFLEEACRINCEAYCLTPSCPTLPKLDSSEKPGGVCGGQPQCPKECKLQKIDASLIWPDSNGKNVESSSESEKTSSEHKSEKTKKESDQSSSLSSSSESSEKKESSSKSTGRQRRASAEGLVDTELDPDEPIDDGSRKDNAATDSSRDRTSTTRKPSKSSSTTGKPKASSMKPSTTAEPGDNPSVSTTTEPPTDKPKTTTTTEPDASTTVSPTGKPKKPLSGLRIFSEWFKDAWDHIIHSFRPSARAKKDVNDLLDYYGDPLAHKKGESRGDSSWLKGSYQTLALKSVFGHFFIRTPQGDCPECAPCQTDSFSCPNVPGCDIFQCACGDDFDVSTPKPAATTTKPTSKGSTKAAKKS